MIDGLEHSNAILGAVHALVPNEGGKWVTLACTAMVLGQTGVSSFVIQHLGGPPPRFSPALLGPLCVPSNCRLFPYNCPLSPSHHHQLPFNRHQTPPPPCFSTALWGAAVVRQCVRWGNKVDGSPSGFTRHCKRYAPFDQVARETPAPHAFSP